MKKQKYTGCDEDCFHCKYKDCRKPAGQIKTDLSAKENKKESCESAPHMYTVMLGGVGRDKPNIARQFWR